MSFIAENSLNTNSNTSYNREQLIWSMFENKELIDSTAGGFAFLAKKLKCSLDVIKTHNRD